MRARVIEGVIVGLIASFAITGLVVANRPMECLFFSFTLFTVLMAAMLAIAKTGGSQIFWVTFAVVSVGYLVFVHREDNIGLVPRHDGPEITTQLLRVAYSQIHANGFRLKTCFTRAEDLETDHGNTFEWPPDPNAPDPFKAALTHVRIVQNVTCVEFMRIGHCAWALLLAWIAAHVTAFTYRRARVEH